MRAVSGAAAATRSSERVQERLPSSKRAAANSALQGGCLRAIAGHDAGTTMFVARDRRIVCVLFAADLRTGRQPDPGGSGGGRQTVGAQERRRVRERRPGGVERTAL